MPKGEIYADLATALRALFNRADSTWNPHSVNAALEIDYQRYGAISPVGYNAIVNAMNGRPINATTAANLSAFVRSIDPELLRRQLKEVDLDLGCFFGTLDTKMSKSAIELEGDYQTYAHANTASDYMRLGRMSFRYNNEHNKPRLLVEEEQYRPQIGAKPSIRLIWEGFAAPRGSRSYFMVMRAKSENLGDGMALMAMVERMTVQDGRVQYGRVHALQYEAEKNIYIKSTCIIARKFDNITYDFVPLIEFDDKLIIEDLWLKETIQEKRKEVADALLLSNMRSGRKKRTSSTIARK